MKTLLTALFALISCICFSQKNPDSLYFAKMKSRKIELRYESRKTSGFIPFHNVTIVDARPDTSSVGFAENSNSFKLYFDKGLANTFSQFINNNYNLSNDSANLLIVIKEYRISNYVNKKGINDNNSTQWNSSCIIDAELFLSTMNTYHALYKIDSIVIALSESETVAELTVASFKAILSKSENKSLSEIHIGKTSFPLPDIQKHIADLSNIPIFKDSVLKKGVYINFNEFKINHPSLENYEIHKGKLSDELFVTENNQSYPLQNFWGYCDGDNMYIYSANNLFKLVRTGNTYNTKAIKSLEKNRGKKISTDVATTYLIGIPMSKLNPDKFKADPAAFQLNMQTGEIY